MWQNWQFFMAKFANFCGKIWQNLGFQMAIFCDARLLLTLSKPTCECCDRQVFFFLMNALFFFTLDQDTNFIQIVFVMIMQIFLSRRVAGLPSYVC